MPNKNYEKGRRKEYKIVSEFRDEGWDIVQRSAGSHSPIDVFCLSKDLKEIVLVQVKPSSMSKNAKNKIEKENSWLNGEFKVRFEVR